MNKSIGEKLKELRKSKGISVEEVCEKLNVSESTYSRMERGETATWISKIDEICDLFKIEPEELILSNEKYIQISKKQKGGSASNITINNTADKTFELYERMLLEKDTEILSLKNLLSTK